MMNGIKKFALDKAYDYIEHNPEENVMKLMDMVDKFAGDGPYSFPKQREAFRNFLNDKDSNWYRLTMHVLEDGSARRKSDRRITVTLPGRFCWILPRRAIFTAPDAGQENMEIS